MHDLLFNAHHLLSASDLTDPSLHQLIETHANLMNGQDLLQSGHLAAQTMTNLDGGQSIFQAGHLVGTTHDVLGSGQSVVDAHGVLYETAHNNILGGQDVFSSTGHLVATSHQTMNGVVQVMDAHGQLAGTVTENLLHNGASITLGSGDPSAIQDVAMSSNFFQKFFS